MATKSIKEVLTDKIWADNDRNFRHSWKYKVEPKANFDPEKDVPGFYEDIVLNGVRVNIEVAQLTDDQKDRIEAKHGIRPDFRVIRGHRRFGAVGIARKSDPSLFKKLSVVVYVGLTEREEISLMYDDNGIERLDEFETYTAIKRLYGTALSQEAIGAMIGQKRNYVQDRIYIMEMPSCIEDNYRKRFTPVDGKPPVKGKDYFHVTMADLDKLHKAWGADNESKVPHDSPASQFAKIWTEITTQTVPVKGTGTKALTKAEMDKRTGLVKGCEALEEAHRFYNGDGGNLMEAAEQYRNLEAAAKSVPALKSEIEALKAQVSDLVAQLDSLKTENAQLVEHLDSLPATNGQTV